MNVLTDPISIWHLLLVVGVVWLYFWNEQRKLKQEIKDLGFSFQKRHRAHSLHVPYWWLKCLFWGQGETNSLIDRYHDFLVWDLMQKPRITRWMETFLDPLLGKSVAMYFCKPKN